MPASCCGKPRRRESAFQQIKDQLFTRARQLRQILPGRNQVPRVGIPADIWNLGPWESKPRKFLLRFLKRLGVEVVQEGNGASEAGPLAAIQGEIAKLQEKADLVLLPLWQGLGTRPKR